MSCSIIKAIENNEIKTVQQLIKSNIDINRLHIHPRSYDLKLVPLIEAIRRNHVEIVEILIKAGADVNFSDFDSPLKNALDYDYGRAHEQLPLEKYQDECIKNLITSFINKTHGDRDKIIEMIIEAKADVNSKEVPIIEAVYTKRCKLVEMLIKANADVNRKKDTTALIAAVNCEKIDILEILLKAKADVNIRDQFGVTPLMRASVDKEYEMFDLLLKSDSSNLNNPEGDGHTLLTYASRANRIEIVEMLIKANADVNATCKYGDNPLIHASEKNNSKVIEILLKENADVNMQNEEGKTCIDFCNKNTMDIINDTLDRMRGKRAKGKR